MLLRYRWFRLGLPHDAEIGAVAEACGLRAGDGTFVRAELSDGDAGFRFHWESAVNVTRIAPNGTVHREQISSTSFSEFTLMNLGKRTALLRLVEPGRNVRPLMVALEHVYGFGFTCAAVALGKTPPLSVLDHVDEARLVGLKLSNVVVRRTIIARMEFAAKGGMSEADLGSLAHLEQTREQATYDLVYRGVRGHLSYSASGLVRVGGALAPRILSFVESDVTRIAGRVLAIA